MSRIFVIIISLLFSVTGCTKANEIQHNSIAKATQKSFIISDTRYPRLAEFLQQAIQITKVRECTINHQRQHTFPKKLQSKKSYIRVQWPLEICEESSSTVYTEDIESKQLDGSVEWLHTQLHKHPTGRSLVFVIGDKQQIHKEIITKEKR